VASETYTSSTVAQARRGAVSVPAPSGPETGPESWTPNWNASTGSAPNRTKGREPRLRAVMGVCGWAAVLGGVGLVLGVRGLIGVLTKSAPGWFEPAMSLTGVVGIALTVGGFLTVHRRRAPWAFLAAASLVLIVAMVLTSKAF
jgi:hypothetical protein